MNRQSDSYVPPSAEIGRAFGDVGADDVTFVARLCLELGAWDHALAVCEALGQSESPAVRLCEAVARFVSGDAEAGLGIVNALLADQPNHLSAQFVRAQMLARAGDHDGARRQLLDLVARYPDYPGAQGMLSTLVMPGPHYREVLARIHDRLKPRCYLEVGVDTGATLALARFSEIVVGVDPAERPLQAGVPKHTRLFREESETFFEGHRREQVLGNRRLDLAFIDGLHLFENTLTDFANVERWAHGAATIVLHDCVPIVPRTASRERRTKFWVGDTWKVVMALARFRPELRIRTILAPPSGLVVIRRLNPGSNLILDRFQELLHSLESESWEREPGDFPAEFGVVANDEQGLREALG